MLSVSKPNGEILLRLAHDVVRAKLHDAHRVARAPVVGDDQFGDPQVTAAAHAPDDEPAVPGGGPLALNVVSPAEPLTRLWILKNERIRSPLRAYQLPCPFLEPYRPCSDGLPTRA
jgi:hypothetical protein